MRLIGNIIWCLTGGWLTALMWLVFGVLCCVTVVGIPFGIQCFKCMRIAFAPFGKKVKLHPGRHLIANILWLLVFGWGMFVAYFAAGVICCVTIVGIPAGLVSFKMMKLALMPFGAKIEKKI